MSAPTPTVLEIHSGIVLKGELSMTRDVVLTGKFEGSLKTLGCLTVASGGEVRGSIEAGALVLEPGNQVAARVTVATVTRTPSQVHEEAKKDEAVSWTGKFQKFKEFALGRK